MNQSLNGLLKKAIIDLLGQIESRGEKVEVRQVRVRVDSFTRTEISNKV